MKGQIPIDTRAVELFQAVLSEKLGGNAILSSEISESLSRSNFRVLDINGAKLTHRLNDGNLAGIVAAIIDCSLVIDKLSLKNHRITSFGIESTLGRFITEGNLRHLDLQGNEIDGKGIAALRLRSSDCPLVSLNLSFNHNIGREGGMLLSESLPVNKRLKHLILNNCGFDLTTIIAITSSIGENIALETLEIDRPLLTTTQEEGIDHLSRIILQSPSLVRISVRQSKINDFGARLLAESLSRNRSLRSLNLERNRIGVAGAEALASYLIMAKNQGLEELFLSYNEIGNAGCIALSEALQKNSALRELTLKSNKIDEALSDLGRAMERNSSLVKLSIFGNNFDQFSGEIFLSLIEHRFRHLEVQIDIDVSVVDKRFEIAEVSF